MRVNDKVLVWRFGIETDFGMRGFSKFWEAFLDVSIYMGTVICIRGAVRCIRGDDLPPSVPCNFYPASLIKSTKRRNGIDEFPIRGYFRKDWKPVWLETFAVCGLIVAYLLFCNPEWEVQFRE